MSVVSGFSQSTGMPRSRQALTCSSCAAPGVAISTASTSGSLIAAIGSSTTRAPIGAATSRALSAKKSLITVTFAPRIRLLSASTWKAPIMPTPSTAIRRSDIQRSPMSVLPRSRLAELHELR